MTAMRFVDTNVLLYAACALSEEANKRHRAIDLLKEGDLALSVQVIQEFYYQSTRVSRQAHINHEQAINFIGSMDTFPVQPINLDIFHAAVSISQRFQLSYWDGAILAAARALRCDAVYSEDMSSEQDYDGLRVINPFAAP